MRFVPKFSSDTLMCFSPAVMLLTLTLEFIFAVYIFVNSLIRRKSATIIMAILICLGIFQLAEFQVCGGSRTLTWMRLGYIAITLLPALGIHLVSLVSGRKVVRYIGYAVSAVFIWVFLFSPQSIHAAVCGGNYVLINTSGVVAATYFPLYYYISLAIAVVEIIYFVLTHTNKESAISRSLLYWLLGGYATFIIPTAAVYLISPAARRGIPSIMCGFAVFLAIVITFFVYPRFKKLGI